MSILTNPLDSHVSSAFSGQADRSVINAIHQASEKTGMDFAYLMRQAAAESSFDPDAKAQTSSATGLYQFIESTWLNMIEKHGEKYGVQKDLSKEETLALRKDPALASNMAAELARDNEQFLQMHWGGDVGATELYLAHFLGAGGAASFLKARDENPLEAAAHIFPAAAKANYNVFYKGDTGRAKSLEEVYAFFDKKFTPEDMSEIQIAEKNSYKDRDQTPVFYAKPNSVVRRAYPSGLSEYQQMIVNPVQLMLLSQLEVPFAAKENSGFF